VLHQLPPSFSAALGTRIAEYLGEGYPRGTRPGPGVEKELVWFGFAFIRPDQSVAYWSRFRGPEYADQRAALSFLFTRKGEGYLPWFESNFKELYGGTPVALDPDNPNMVDAAAGIAAVAWGEDDE
jgi:hypothetical protein